MKMKTFIQKYFGSRTIVSMTHSTFSNLKTIPDFPGWFYCLGLRSKAGRSCKNLCLHIISSFEHNFFLMLETCGTFF